MVLTLDLPPLQKAHRNGLHKPKTNRYPSLKGVRPALLTLPTPTDPSARRSTPSSCATLVTPRREPRRHWQPLAQLSRHKEGGGVQCGARGDWRFGWRRAGRAGTRKGLRLLVGLLPFVALDMSTSLRCCGCGGKRGRSGNGSAEVFVTAQAGSALHGSLLATLLVVLLLIRPRSLIIVVLIGIRRSLPLVPLRQTNRQPQPLRLHQTTH